MKWQGRFAEVRRILVGGLCFRIQVVGGQGVSSIHSSTARESTAARPVLFDQVVVQRPVHRALYFHLFSGSAAIDRWTLFASRGKKHVNVVSAGSDTKPFFVTVSGGVVYYDEIRGKLHLCCFCRDRCEAFSSRGVYYR